MVNVRAWRSPPLVASAQSALAVVGRRTQCQIKQQRRRYLTLLIHQEYSLALRRSLRAVHGCDSIYLTFI